MSDMTTLFFKDPLEMTDEDIDAIIEKMREQRAQFKQLPTKTAGTSAATKAVKAGLGDLKLDI